LAGRLIIVDDDAEARTLARKILEGGGMDVEEAAGSQEFFALLERTGDPDVVVLDLTMPGPSGWTVLNKLRTDAARARLPVVIVTSHDDVEFKAAAKKAGVKHYLTKPYQPWQLLDAVRSSGLPPTSDPWARRR
jgi:CheY-like chemotaxis protein